MSACVHCRERESNRPRRLCYVCYYTPGVRDRYPKVIRRAASDSDDPSLPPVPTQTPRFERVRRGGMVVLRLTAERLAVLRERVARRESVTHEGDCG